MQLSQEEEIQYSRHLLLPEIGEPGQLKLKTAKVLVVGAGGLGCPILQYLAAAGVGNIGIIDNDTVDQSNLQRQILYGHNDLGNSKAESASKRLNNLNPFIQITAYNLRLNKSNILDLFRAYDIIVDGTDNFETRYLINDAAVITQKPVVFGSIHKFEGQVTVFNHQKGPTYRCLFPTPPNAEESPNCSAIGVLGVLPAIIGSLQANETLKIILELGNILSGKLLVYDALAAKQTIFSYPKSNITITQLTAPEYHNCAVVNYKEISFDQIAKQNTNYQLLDVRSAEQHQQHNIGGLHIPIHQLKERLMEIPAHHPLLVYCNKGITSQAAIQIIGNARPEITLYNLSGGISSAQNSTLKFQKDNG